MIEIKLVEQDRKDRSRYHIYGDGDEPVLTVHEDLLIRHMLLKGQSFTAAQLAEIRDEDQRYQVYARAIFYLGFKARTSKQIEQYLTRKLFEPEYISYAIGRLESEHLVDDDEYARQFVKQRVKSGQKGRHWIKQELQQRGVSKEIASEAASHIDRETELSVAKYTAEKKWRSLKGEPNDRRRKLIQFLMRRGFPGDIVKDAVKWVIIDMELESIDDEDGLLLDN